MLENFDARLKFGLPAAVVVYAFSVAISQRPLAALILVLSWVAALVLGVRAKRIWLSLQGYQVLRSSCSDRWSHGFLAAAVIVFSLATVANFDIGTVALIFSVGSNIFYAAGKLGCSVFGCCQLRSHGVALDLPRIEAATCLIACVLALPLAAYGSSAAGVFVSAGVYAVVRGTSVVLRHQGREALNIVDPLIALLLVGHASMTRMLDAAAY